MVETNKKVEFKRLPKDFIPIHYDLSFTPDLEKCTFTGKAEITLKVDIKSGSSSVNTIKLNAVDLDIKKATLNDDEDSLKAEVSYDKEAETADLTFPYDFNKKNGEEIRLKMDFIGVLNDLMKGFYRSTYKGKDESVVLNSAVTQFEATDARRCFPGWDEPACKATFTISLNIPKNRVGLSNMPVKEEIEDPQDSSRKILRFEKSPVMSTYLLAMIVGEYESIETVGENGVLIKVWVPLGKKEQGEFALETQKRSLTYYNDFFQIPYPLPKYDTIAISDFQAGAMENWGLITYREVCLLVDPKNTSKDTKQYVAIVVTHEMAHQWFGNLVTMEWWTHLWLNEGFASFMQLICTDYLFPEFNIVVQFVNDDTISALELDALENSHPIEVEVGHPDEVNEIFDDISYKKGASVIRMLFDYIGEEAFKKGLNSYLKKHSYKNTETRDLWKALEEASGKPVEDVMSTWTLQKGFPLVKVVSSRMDGNKKILTLSQSKFNADGSNSEGYLWKIPISILTAKGNVVKALMENQTMEIELEGLSENDWFKVNTSFIGFYRVQYEAKDQERLAQAVLDKSLNEIDQLSLISDMFALIRCGKASVVEGLKLVTAFKHDENYSIWRAIISNLNKVEILISQENYLDKFTSFAINLMSEVMSKVGWESSADESHSRGLLRQLVLKKMGKYGDEVTIKEAEKRFAQHISGGVRVEADLLEPVYYITMANGNRSTFDQIIKMFRETDFSEEQERLLTALGHSPDKNLLQEALVFGFSDEVRNNNFTRVMGPVAVNKKGRKLAWEFFKTNYDEIYKRYYPGAILIALVQQALFPFTTKDEAQEVEEFFKSNPNPGERSLKQAIEEILLNAAWMERDGEALKKFFTDLKI